MLIDSAKFSEFLILIMISIGLLQPLSSTKDPYNWTVNPPKLRLSIFFELLQKYANTQGYGINQLYSYQRKGIRKIFAKKNVLVVVPTAGGKTLVAFACLWHALIKQQIGVYLVPQNQLLSQKVKEITQFFGNFAHIVTLSGEFKPPASELRKNWKRLILVGTYEAFRSLLFSIQIRAYFPKEKCIGGVVIDEIHIINDRERGPKLETLIYKLQKEYQSQFCFLSGTFNKQSAKYWRSKFKCDLIYLNPSRLFRYEERIIILNEEEKQEKSKRKLKAILFEKEKEAVLNVIEEFIEEHEDQTFIPYKLFPARMLVFCYSRDYAEEIASAINERWGMTTDIHCDHLHAGIDRADQRDIFTDFSTPEGIRILCCSPLLETGVDIPNVEAIVVLNPERYDGIRLAQMCGRTREEVGKVIFIFSDDNKYLIHKILQFAGESPVSKLKGFVLEPIKSRISTSDVESWLALEALFGHELSRSDLKHQLQKFKVGFDIDAILSPKGKFTQHSFIRSSGGRYGLTYIGIATVEAGLDPDDAIECLKFLENMDALEEGEAEEKYFSVTARKLLGTLVANKVYADSAYYLSESSAIWVLMKRYQARNFIYHYNEDSPDHTEDQRIRNEVKEGDAEILRRTAVWLASSLYLLYHGFKLHSEAQASAFEQQYYQIRSELLFEEDQIMFNRLLRLIRRYQASDEKRTKKPRMRPHPVFIPTSQYEEPVLKYLKECKTKGITKRGIRQKLKEDLKLLVPDSSLHSTLNQTLKDKVVRQLEPIGKGNRLQHRYRLKQYPPRRPKEITFITQPTKKKPHLFHDFEIIEEQVKCPACHRLGTVQIPTEEKLTQCKVCKAIFRRTRWGHFKWKDDCRFEKDRLLDDAGFPYIEITQEKRLLFLKESEKLQLRQKKSGMPYFSIMGRGGSFIYPEEIYKIVLAGGTIGSGFDLLKKHRIRTKFLSDTEIQRIQDEEAKAQQLRDTIRSLEGTARLKKARDLTISKILSNLYYTFKLGEEISEEILPLKKVQDLALKQYDHLTQVFFTLEEKNETDLNVSGSTMLMQLFQFLFGTRALSLSDFDAHYSAKLIDKLRSQEGNAEIAAWETIKIVLPIQFQFQSRQIQRVVRSDLYWGPKGHDPFNSGLNFLYYLLGDKAALALHQAGFSRYWPGSGIIHKRRQTRKKRAWVETRENREFLYDFIDLFRAPFRYHLTRAFQGAHRLVKDLLPSSALDKWHYENMLTKSDFFYELDEWHERVYFPTEEGEQKLRDLFDLICSHKFLDGTEEKSLETWMLEKAQDFADSLIGNRMDAVTFLAFEDAQGAAQVLAYFNLIHQFMEYDQIPALQEALSEVPLLEPVPEPVAEELPENVIIISHNDFDGFASTLLLVIKHFGARNLYIVIAENNPPHAFHITKVLENIVPGLLWKKGHNTIIVADFPITTPKEFYRSLKRKYLEKLKGHEDRLQFLWYDHHSHPTFDPMSASEELGIEFIHVPDENRHVYRMIWADLLKKAEETQKQGTRPWDFFQALRLTASGWLATIDDDHYFNKWYGAFRAFYMKLTKRPKNWVKFFLNICSGKPAPELDETLSTTILFHGSIRKTKDGKTFAILIFREYFDVRNVKALLQIYTQQQFPDFVLCYWINHSISLRVFNKENIDLLGLFEDQGLGGHTGAGAIYTPRRAVYQAGLTTIYRFQLIDEFVEWISKSRLTFAPEDLYKEEVISISVQKEAEWVKTWESEKIQRKEIEQSYDYRTSLFYMPEKREEIYDTFSRLSSPFITTVENGDRFKTEAKPLTLQFVPEETLVIPSNDVILFFAEYRNRRHLFQFLYQVLVTYLKNTALNSQEQDSQILYIDTIENTLSLKQFFSLSLPKEYLKTVLFTRIDTFDLVLSFITAYLGSLIEESRATGNGGIKIVVINSLFKSIEDYFKTGSDVKQSEIQQAKTGAQLVGTLRELARKLGVSIILTSLGTVSYSKAQGLSPFLFAAVRNAIHYKALIRQTIVRKGGENYSGFNILIQKGPFGKTYKFHRLFEKLREAIHLSDFSDLPEGIFLDNQLSPAI